MENDTPNDPEKMKIEELLRWTAPSRLFKKRDKEYFTNIGAIVFLLIIILVFAREYMFILAVLSIVFFIYTISTVPPEDIEHRITNLGIESTGHFYRWEELAEFWFEEQWGQVKMVLAPIMGSRIILLLGSVDKKKMREIVSKYIPFREQPPSSFVDNAAKWLTEKVPLDKPS